MIARIVIPLLLIIVLSDVYIDAHYFRKHYKISWWLRLLWWVPTIFLVCYTCILASIRNFAPTDLTWLNTYLVLIGMVVGPKAIFTFFSSIGWFVRKYITHTHRNWGHYVGLLVGALMVGTYIYGLTLGFSEIRVKNIDLSFEDLPESFDGYRIVHVSDLHLGTFQGWRENILKAEMDSIAKQKADLILFTGDIQNMRPQEVETLAHYLKEPLKGTIAVLGNHDYTEYVKGTPEELSAQERRLQSVIRDTLGWTLLNNSSVEIYNGKDHIYICGEENDGKPPFPHKVDVAKAMKGISKEAFVIMLQHDPSAWRRSILPNTHAQLTLSGHTHGGQMQIFGLRPTHLRLTEDYGLYEDNGRMLYITAGLGGLVPFRLNMPNEITVITLHSKKK
ncbi:metallophosphoesterase [Prevotella sp. HUN102]|uniref:metallophosphoesterase n=1 Tax=Prevotella sp. HUN102 TaxID=1392486 RepID=UPI00048EA3BD|nr:metallophosphoesterase [Prevotella sp. HUN102]